MTNRAESGRNWDLLSGAGRRQIAAHCTGGRAGRTEYPNLWGQWSRHRRLNVQTPIVERPLAFQTEDGLAI